MKQFLKDFFSNFIGIILCDIYPLITLIIVPIEIIVYMIMSFIRRIRCTDEELAETYSELVYLYSKSLDIVKCTYGFTWNYSISYLSSYIMYKHYIKESKKFTKKLNLKEQEI